MEILNEKNTKRFIFTGNIKCKRTIKSCKTQEQLDMAVDMCNMFGQTVCAMLNSSDFRWIAANWNIHRKWCKRVYGVLSTTLTELDSSISERRAYIEAHPCGTSTVGFK